MNNFNYIPQRSSGTSVNDFCDKCGRSLVGKGYIEISGWRICGICQYEESKKNEV